MRSAATAARSSESRKRVGRSLEALWWWQYSYLNHWGTQAGAALRALHAIVAHALLDVAEEVTPG